MAKLPSPKAAPQQQPMQEVQQATFGAVPAKQASPEDVRKIVLETLGRFLPNGTEGLTDDVEFDDLGLDSLSGVDASRALRTALAPLGITGLKPTFLFEARTLGRVLVRLPVPSLAVLALPAMAGPAAISGPVKTPNFIAIGETSPQLRLFFALVTATMTLVLFMASCLPYSMLFFAISDPQGFPLEQHLVPQIFMLFILTSVMRLYVSILLMWLAKNAFLGSVTEGSWPVWGWKMACFKAIRYFEADVFQSVLMQGVERTEIPNIIWRLMGSHIGRGACILQGDDIPMLIWEMLKVGPNAIMDAVQLEDASRTFHMHRRISIGSNSVIGSHATVRPGTVLKDGAVVLPHSTVSGQQDAVADDGTQILTFPRRTHMSLPASLVALPFLWWLRILSVWPFAIDLAYIFGQYLPLLVAAPGGTSPIAPQWDITMLVILPAIFLLSTLLYGMLVLVVTVGAKWLFLGRLHEGVSAVSPWQLWRLELCMILTTSATSILKPYSCTILNHLFLKAMGADVAWTWIPSSLNAAAYLSADLLSIGSDSSTQGVKLNCITLKSGDDKMGDSTWQMTCRRIQVGASSQLGPLTVLGSGCKVAEEAATVAMTYVPPGTTILPQHTGMGSGSTLPQVKRSLPSEQRSKQSPTGPFAVAVLLNCCAAQVLRLWLDVAIPLMLAVMLCRTWGSPICLSLGKVIYSNSQGVLSAYDAGVDLCRVLLFLTKLAILTAPLSALGHTLLFLLGRYAFLGKLSEGRLRGWMHLKWVSAQIFGLEAVSGLRAFTGTPLLSWLVEAAGGKVGVNVEISHQALMNVPAPELLNLKDGAYLGGSCYAHDVMGRNGGSGISFANVELGAGAHCGGVLLSGSCLPNDAIAMEGAVLLPGHGARATPGPSEVKQYFTGNPAMPMTTPPEGLLELNGVHV